MNTFHDFSDLGELLRVLPARLRLVMSPVKMRWNEKPPPSCWTNAPHDWKPSVTGWPAAMRMCCTPWAAAASW